jgi:hypothetical protein
MEMSIKNIKHGISTMSQPLAVWFTQAKIINIPDETNLLLALTLPFPEQQYE